MKWRKIKWKLRWKSAQSKLKPRQLLTWHPSPWNRFQSWKSKVFKLQFSLFMMTQCLTIKLAKLPLELAKFKQQCQPLAPLTTMPWVCNPTPTIATQTLLTLTTIIPSYLQQLHLNSPNSNDYKPASFNFVDYKFWHIWFYSFHRLHSGLARARTWKKLHAQSLKDIENIHEWQNTIVSKYFKQIMRHFLAHLCSIKSEYKFQFTTWWILLCVVHVFVIYDELHYAIWLHMKEAQLHKAMAVGSHIKFSWGWHFRGCTKSSHQFHLKGIIVGCHSLLVCFLHIGGSSIMFASLCHGAHLQSIWWRCSNMVWVTICRTRPVYYLLMKYWGQELQNTWIRWVQEFKK
jgi:hypothetical protein